jgi:thymidylate synthase (FAD)
MYGKGFDMANVQIVSYSNQHQLFPGGGIAKDLQELVTYCARVSNPGNQHNTETSERLIQYLVKHKHWSPFEMVNVCLEINTTRDIARQLLRHRSFSFQEFSQRYAVISELGGSGFNYQIREARLQDNKNRQASIEIDKNNIEQAYFAHQWEKKQRELLDWVDATYQWAIDNGMAKEQARAILPEGLTMSRLYVNGTLRSWLHYIDVRTEAGTQKEHRELAHLCALEIARLFPSILEFDRAHPAAAPDSVQHGQAY